jgi:glycosyltransferase involved in cell wall biosynthesis
MGGQRAAQATNQTIAATGNGPRATTGAGRPSDLVPPTVSYVEEMLDTSSATGGADLAVTPRNRPTVSICIPAYQAAAHLRTTLDSVLAQDYPDMEVVVIDNNSTDETAAILESIGDERVRVFRNPVTVSAADNHNLAVRRSRGRFVKVLSADDIIDPDCIATQVEVFARRPDVAVVAARTDFIDNDGRLLVPARGVRGIVGPHPAHRVIRHIVRSGRNPIGAPASVMFRRADFDRCGGFRRDTTYTTDVDLWARLLDRGNFYGIGRTLASFRVHSGSLSDLTSMRSQLAQHAELDRGLGEDPRWGLSRIDRALGRVNAYQALARRLLLFKLSSRRASRRQRKAMEAVIVGFTRDPEEAGLVVDGPSLVGGRRENDRQ